MDDKAFEIFKNFEIKDNDEEDDKMEEHEINAQLNIIPDNNNQIKNEKDEEKVNIDLNDQLNINIDNNGLPDSGTKSIFENPYLQTSYNLFTKLRRIIIRKENLTKINYFDKWRKNIKNQESNNIPLLNTNNQNISQDNNILIQNRNIIQNILKNDDNNDNIDINIDNNKSHNEVILEHQNQLLKSGNQNIQTLINPFASIRNRLFLS